MTSAWPRRRSTIASGRRSGARAADFWRPARCPTDDASRLSRCGWTWWRSIRVPMGAHPSATIAASGSEVRDMLPPRAGKGPWGQGVACRCRVTLSAQLPSEFVSLRSMEMAITMSPTEQHRVRILARVLQGELSMAAGAIELGLSEPQLWRLRSGAFERDCPAGLVHGNRGRPSPRRIDPARGTGPSCRAGDARRDERQPLRRTPRRAGVDRQSPGERCGILRAAGIASSRRRRPPRHRSRQPRMAAEGQLLQLDGSRTTGSRPAVPASA